MRRSFVSLLVAALVMSFCFGNVGVASAQSYTVSSEASTSQAMIDGTVIGSIYDFDIDYGVETSHANADLAYAEVDSISGTLVGSLKGVASGILMNTDNNTGSNVQGPPANAYTNQINSYTINGTGDGKVNLGVTLTLNQDPAGTGDADPNFDYYEVLGGYAEAGPYRLEAEIGLWGQLRWKLFHNNQEIDSGNVLPTQVGGQWKVSKNFYDLANPVQDGQTIWVNTNISGGPFHNGIWFERTDCHMAMTAVVH